MEGEAEDDDGNQSEKSECFFAGKDTAMGLTLKDIPTRQSERRLSTDSVKSTNSTQSNNSDIQQHLQSMIDLLNPEETLKMAVKLESQRPNRTRYLVIVSRCCYHSPTTDRKSKIMRQNSTKTRSITAATTNIVAMHQSSTDGILRAPQPQQQSPQQQQPLQQQHQTQTESSSGEDSKADVHEKHNTNVLVTTTATQRPSQKSDSEKISASGDGKDACEDGVEESCLLGIDCNERTTIGLVLPILADTTIHLDGDGGFSVSVYGKTHIFKPVSVQAMWSALQTLHKVSQKARENNFYPRGPSHDWTSYYDSHIESEQSCLNEWNAMDSLESRRPPSPDAIRNKPTAKEETEGVIKMKLKEIMMSVDLDEVTSKYIRGRLEELLDMDLGEFKSFIDAEMLTILGKMDAPTEIFDHVYLGSEWNASNLEELQKNGIRHILNVTREIDNFFPGVFDYFNVRVYDDEKTNLLKHWDNTFRYITRAKSEGSKVLVHCKMGVSRSASVVIAYAMKAYNWEFKHALQHVKDRRNCIKPNKNFLNQLETYRGMLDAMKNKEKLQRSKSETNLKSTKDARLLPGSEPTPLIQALNQSKSKAGGVIGAHDVVSCGDNIIACADVGSDVNIIKHIGRRSKASTGRGKGDVSDSKQNRLVRRSSSTSPQAVPHVPLMTAAIKQQSQSLENLTPERSVAEEPKNMRFPGSNGENYSVTQNQVRHIQKNVQPPPPPPPPPPTSSIQRQQQQQKQLQQQKKQRQQQIASVRTRVQDLETHTNTRKTADDRRSLNLQFGRSVSHDTGATTSGVGKTLQSEDSPVWTSSAKLITQTCNFKSTAADASESVANNRTSACSDMLSNQHNVCSDFGSSDAVPMDATSTDCSNDGHQVGAASNARRHSRKTHSWTAAGGGHNSGTGDLLSGGNMRSGGGGIVLDRLNVLCQIGGATNATSNSGPSSKLGSNSSIDSAYEERVAVTPRTQRHRDLPARHASWGSGDTRCAVPVRNSSWAAFDSNRNSCHYGGGSGGAILEGQIHELNINKSNKTVSPPSHPIYQNISAGSTQYQHQHVGTVKRTKQKLEQCGSGNNSHTLKKLCAEEDGEPTMSDESTIGTTSVKRNAKGTTNLFRSASAAGSTRIRCSPYRCNSVEIVPGGAVVAGAVVASAIDSRNPAVDILTCNMVMRRSDGSRPLHNELLSASSAPDSYTMSDIENKNTLPPSQTMRTTTTIAGEHESIEDDAVVLRGGGVTSLITDQQRISGSVQILKKNFEAKAGTNITTTCSSTTSANVLQVQQTVTDTTAKKGHHSLPSSPVAQHIDPHHQHTTHNPPHGVTLDMPTTNTDSLCEVELSTAEILNDTNTLLTNVPAYGTHSLTTTNITQSATPATSVAAASTVLSSSASSSSSSSTSSASSMCEPFIDRNVKVLVHKYQTPTALTTTASRHDNLLTSSPASTLTASSMPITTSSKIVVPTAPAVSLTKPRRHSYYESGGQHGTHHKTMGSVTGGDGKNVFTPGRLLHEYNDSRPPPSPAKAHSGATQIRETIGDNTQQQQQHQQRRLPQHGRTHPLSRLTLPKQSFNTAAYNTM
ncbi:protein phosphatase Slingshot isoform X2 [Eurosta solidaginis]|uniref:protein phosphatase Slingshot isoform X2 n=1 Tax=Eurosta solidaginis TaxID=178769 RepID=UPI003530C18B